MSFNKVIIIGNLVRDPDLKTTTSGNNICKITLAVNRTYNKVTEVTYIDCDAFGKTAETIGKYFAKGKPILIEGRLKTDTWLDKKTGENRSKLAIAIESFSFVGGKSDKSDEPQASEQTKQPWSEDAPF